MITFSPEYKEIMGDSEYESPKTSCSRSSQRENFKYRFR